LQELEGKAREARQEREARQAKLEAVLATVQAGSLWVSARGVSASSSTRRSSEGGLHTWWMKRAGKPVGTLPRLASVMQVRAVLWHTLRWREQRERRKGV